MDILFQWAESRFDRLLDVVADFVHERVDVLVAVSGPAPALAAKSATGRIPVVFVSGGDPSSLGLVASFGRPGGNVTGVAVPSAGLVPKRLDLLREIAPAAKLIGFLVNSAAVQTKSEIIEAETAARRLGTHLVIVNATTPIEIEHAFETIARQKIGALMVADEPLFFDRGAQVAALAARHAVPAIHAYRQTVEAGGLMSYGADIADALRLAGVCTGRILNGDTPADLAVQQPTRVETVLNLKAAKAVGLEFPSSVLVRADKVVE